MASLRLRGNSYHVCFRFDGKQYDRSLKTTDKAEANCALHGIEQLLHRLHTGQKTIPNGVDPGCFIVSGGTERPVKAKQQIPTLEDAVGNYLRSCEHRLSDSYVELQRTHLGHFRRFVGNADSLRCDQVVLERVEEFLQARLSMRDPVTVRHERNTLIRFFDWAVNRKYTAESPAAASERITAGTDRDRFRTKDEITKILSLGDFDETETMELWECLFLNTAEIAELLQAVRSRSTDVLSVRLHTVPAYTGMRRGEVLRLRWTDVDFDEGFLTARSRKQSRQQRETARRIDLHPALRELMLTWQSQCKSARHVIGMAGSTQQIDCDKANRLFWRPMRGTEWCIDTKKNWFKVGFHTYRHSFASNLAAAGVDQRVIDEFMGHTTEAMRKRYRHLFPSVRRAAIEKLVFDGKGRPEESADKKQAS